jgi:hypothetical protein
LLFPCCLDWYRITVMDFYIFIILIYIICIKFLACIIKTSLAVKLPTYYHRNVHRLEMTNKFETKEI